MRKVINHGVKDSKGRELGSVISTGAVAGGFQMFTRSARDGEGFGALGSDRKVYATEAEAVAAAEAHAAKAGERVRRDAAKTGGVYLTASERRALAQG